MILDEIDRDRATRKRFEAQRTGAGEQIEHPRAGKRLLQNAEPRLFHSVAGRAYGSP